MQYIKINTIPAFVSRILLFICITALCISPAFAIGAGARNLLLITLMGISPIIFIIYPVFGKIDIIVLLLISTTISFPLLNHPETMRYSTILYTCMFFLYFMVIYRLLYFSDSSAKSYGKLLRILILAYSCVLLIQQFCVLIGLPIFNVSNYNITEPWKLNSLMSEPEHSGRMIGLLMFSYLTIQDCIHSKKLTFIESWNSDKFVWIAFLWSMLTMVSAGAYLFLFLVILKFLNKRQLIPLACIVTILIIIAVSLEIKPFMRTYKLILSLFTFDIKEIYRTDQSGALRFVPSLICIEKIDLSTFDGWFGHGVDYVKGFIYRFLPGVAKGYVGGGSFQYALEYGFINFIIYCCFSFYACFNKEHKIVTIIFWFFSVLLSGINLQITWATIILLFCNKKIIALNTYN